MKNNLMLKDLNRKNIYRFIYNSEGVSKQDIVQELGLSLPTVTQNLNELKKRGLVSEQGSFESTGGRKAKIICSNDRHKLALGMDITRNHVSLVLTDLKGQIICNKRIRFEFKNEDSYFEELGHIIEKFTADSGEDTEKILGMGISLPAIVGADGKSIIYMSILPADGRLFEKIKKYVPYEMKFFNDGNSGGFAEFWRRDSQDPIVYLSLSNSVGGAIMYSQNAYGGMNHRSGEFGHITLVPEGRPCYCGQRGCADAYCNAKLLSDLTDGSLAEFFNKVKSGDELCAKTFDEYLYYVSQLVYNLRMTFDCDVVLGGYVGSYMEEHLEKLVKLVNDRNPFDKNGSYVKVCNYKFEASAVGAALHFADNFIAEI